MISARIDPPPSFILLKSTSHLQDYSLHSPKTAALLQKPVCLSSNQSHVIWINVPMSISMAKLHLPLLSWTLTSGRVCQVNWMTPAQSITPGRGTWVRTSCSLTPGWNCLCGSIMFLSFPHSWRPVLLQHPCLRPFLLIAPRLCISCIQSANEISFLVLLQGKGGFLHLPIPICTSGHLTFWTFMSYGRFTWNICLVFGVVSILQWKATLCLRTKNISPFPDDSSRSPEGK